MKNTMKITKKGNEYSVWGRSEEGRGGGNPKMKGYGAMYCQKQKSDEMRNATAMHRDILEKEWKQPYPQECLAGRAQS